MSHIKGYNAQTIIFHIIEQFIIHNQGPAALNKKEKKKRNTFTQSLYMQPDNFLNINLNVNLFIFTGTLQTNTIKINRGKIHKKD